MTISYLKPSQIYSNAFFLCLVLKTYFVFQIHILKNSSIVFVYAMNYILPTTYGMLIFFVNAFKLSVPY